MGGRFGSNLAIWILFVDLKQGEALFTMAVLKFVCQQCSTVGLRSTPNLGMKPLRKCEWASEVGNLVAVSAAVMSAG